MILLTVFFLLFMWFPRLVQRSEMLSGKLNMMSSISSCVGRLTVPNGKRLFDFVWRQKHTSFPESLGCLWVRQNEDLMNLLCSLSFKLHSQLKLSSPFYVLHRNCIPIPSHQDVRSDWNQEKFHTHFSIAL